MYNVGDQYDSDGVIFEITDIRVEQIEDEGTKIIVINSVPVEE